MDKMPINYKSLIINNVVGSITFLKAKIANITLLLLLLLQGSVSSCEHVSEAELRQADDSANNDPPTASSWTTFRLNMSSVRTARGWS